jgi:DNA invertase Pin-like site-specific DNA recombinase
VELVRVSTRGQDTQGTPEDQRRALDRLRKSRPGTLVERIEQQVSGAAAGENRPDLQRLARLAQARAFDEVRVRHLDRLTRHEDPLERAAVLSVVRKAGAVIVDASGAVLDPSTMPGELMWVFSTLGAAEERKKIAERTSGGKRRLAAEGRLVSGVPPWGRAFDKATGAWSLTKEARDYRRLFDLALDGLTLSQIAEALTDEGVSSQRGCPWTTGMIWNLLRARHATGLYRTHGHEFAIPSIVDAATQAEVLSLLRGHDHAGGPHTRHEALLRGVLLCGECGARLRTNRNSGRPGAKPPPPFYRCPACRDPIHRIAAVDEAVKARLREWLSLPATLALGEDPSPEAERPEIAARRRAQARRKLEAEESRLARLTVSGVLSEAALKREAEGLQRRRAALDEEERQTEQRRRFLARQAEHRASLSERWEEIRGKAEPASFAEWLEVVGMLFPPGYGVTIWPNGRIKIRAAVEMRRGHAPSSSRKGWNVSPPHSVDLAARKEWTPPRRTSFLSPRSDYGQGR